MTNISRGDIVRVTFPSADEGFDETIEDPHPAVVVQNDGLNANSDTTIVVPLTSGSDPDRLYEVKLTPPQDGVENESLAQIPQLTVVSIPEQIKDESEDESAWKEGEISDEKLNEIENKIEFLLCLT